MTKIFYFFFILIFLKQIKKKKKKKKGNTKRKNAKFTQQISTTVRDNTKHVGLMIIIKYLPYNRDLPLPNTKTCNVIVAFLIEY
jgi:hypothetical protein